MTNPNEGSENSVRDESPQPLVIYPKDFKDDIVDAWPRGWITDREVSAFLKRFKKEKTWMAVVKYRDGLIPSGKVLKGVVVVDKKHGLKNTRGKRVAYPRDILGYLEKIIKLNAAGNTYAKIKEMDDIQAERKRLQLLIDNLLGDPRIIDADMGVAFRVALKFLKQVYFNHDDAFRFLAPEEWEKARERLAKKYFDTSEKMIGKTASSEGYQELKKKRDSQGRKIDVLNAFMKTVIKQGVQLVKDGDVKAAEWLREVTAMKE